MLPSTTLERQDVVSRKSSFKPASILHAIEHGANLLPAQGPITAFVHHNTLHAFEHLDFDEAVRKGGRLFGCHPYLPEKNYREMLSSGRIRNEDIEAVLIDRLGDRADDLLGFLGTRFSLYRAILGHSLHDGPSVDLRWVIGDTNALNKFRNDAPIGIKKQFIDDTRQWVMRDLRNKNDATVEKSARQILESLQARYQQLFDLFNITKIENWPEDKWESFVLHLLWKTCEEGAVLSNDEPEDEQRTRHLRHRDWLLDLTCEDSDELVHELMIPFCAAFLDQGFSNWQLANRDQGFFAAFVAMYGKSSGLAKPWRKELADVLQRHGRQRISPAESISQSLFELGVADGELASFISDTLLSLRGFAGMLWQLESRGDRVNRAMPEGTLIEYLAIHLILDRLATRYVARTNTDFTGELSNLRRWVNDELNQRRTNRTTKQ